MRTLKTLLQGSSVVECVVASAIWMISFTLALDIFVKITAKVPDTTIDMLIHLSIQQCYQKYSTGQHEPGSYQESFEWGHVQIVIIPYRDKLQQLTIEANPSRGGTKWTYRHLIKSYTHEN